MAFSGAYRLPGLTAQHVRAFPIGTLEGFHVETHLLAKAAGDEAADVVGLPIGRVHGIDKQMQLGRRVSRYISA
jgi:hypothetical protein